MSTPLDEMPRRRTAAQSRLATVPPTGNAPVGPATVQPRWTPPAAAPSAIWTPPGTAAAPAAPAVQTAALPTSTMVRERLGAAQTQALPAYRTPNGFTQTPAPTNPNPRPMPAAAEVPTGPTGAAQRAPGAGGRPLRPTGGKIGPGSAAALALEGLNIAGAAQRDGVRGAVTETAAAGTRLGAAKLGAEIGGRLPLPGAWKAAGVALGGIAGYAGGQQVVDYARQNTPPWVSKALDTLSTASDIPSATGAVGRQLGMKAGMRLIQGPNDSVPAPAVQMPAGRMIQGPNAAAAAKLATTAPAAAATQQQNVIGTFQMQGRPERQVFADGSVTPAAAGANGAFSVIPAYQGSPAPAAAARLSTPTIGGAGFADSERRQFNEQIDAQIRGLGELNMASKRRLVADLLGLKGQSVGRAFDAANGRNTAQAELAQRGNEAQLRADIDREQIAAGERASKRSARAQTQTITAEDGTVYSIEGSTLTPLATAGGEQIKAPRKVTPNPQAEIAAKLLEGMVLPGASPEEIQAAAQQAQSAAAALLSSGTGGAQATSAPKSGEIVAGYRFNGGDPNDQKNWTKVE